MDNAKRLFKLHTTIHSSWNRNTCNGDPNPMLINIFWFEPLEQEHGFHSKFCLDCGEYLRVGNAYKGYGVTPAICRCK